MSVYASLIAVLSRFSALAPTVLASLAALFTSPCARPTIPIPAPGPVALKAFIEKEDVREALEHAAESGGWRAPEDVRECVRALGEAWGWKNGDGKQPLWASEPDHETDNISNNANIHEQTKAGTGKDATESQKSDDSVVPPSVEDISSPSPFALLSMSSPMLSVLPNSGVSLSPCPLPVRPQSDISKGKGKERVMVNCDREDEDQDEDRLATPKARPRVFGSGASTSTAAHGMVEEDMDVPVLPLGPSSSPLEIEVARGRSGLESGNGHRGTSAERESSLLGLNTE